MDLVFLHGPAAAGKLTVGRALAERTGFALFHNHLVVDALTAVFPFGSEPFVRLREETWLAVFADAARAERSIVFTFTPEPTVAPGFPELAREAVESAGGRIRFVRLEVSPEEQARRVALPSRREFHKLADPALLAGDRDRVGVKVPPVDLAIDTERADPDAAADAIIRGFGLEPQPPHERYPAEGGGSA